MSFFSGAVFHGCDCERTRCTALRKQRFQRSHPHLQRNIAVSIFPLVVLKAAVVVINFVFVCPIEPVTLAEIARDPETKSHITLPLEGKTVLQDAAVQRRNRGESLPDQDLVDQLVSVSEEER